MKRYELLLLTPVVAVAAIACLFWFLGFVVALVFLFAPPTRTLVREFAVTWFAVFLLCAGSIIGGNIVARFLVEPPVEINTCVQT